MEQLPLNPILKFHPNQLHEVRKLFGLDDKDKLNQAIDQFHDWIKKQNHFDFTDFGKVFSYASHFIDMIISNKLFGVIYL